jgi:hypothetical protein
MINNNSNLLCEASLLTILKFILQLFPSHGESKLFLSFALTAIFNKSILDFFCIMYDDQHSKFIFIKEYQDFRLLLGFQLFPLTWWLWETVAHFDKFRIQIMMASAATVNCWILCLKPHNWNYMARKVMCSEIMFILKIKKNPNRMTHTKLISIHKSEYLSTEDYSSTIEPFIYPSIALQVIESSRSLTRLTVNSKEARVPSSFAFGSINNGMAKNTSMKRLDNSRWSIN